MYYGQVAGPLSIGAIGFTRKLLLVTFILICSPKLQNENFTQTGKASFYANKFEGRKTASGEVFRQNVLTAAHKTLTFGTMVKVTNLKNDSIVLVKINDRLSKSSKHVIDLSLKAAKQLNFVRNGYANVKIDKIE